MAKKTSKKKTNKFPKELYDRARKIGLAPEVIAAMPSAEALKAKCDTISPRTNPDAKPQKGEVPEPKDNGKIPANFEFESMLEARLLSCNRQQFDEANLQAELRKMNRKYGTHKPVRILRDECSKPVRGKNKVGQNAKMYVTKFTVIYKDKE